MNTFAYTIVESNSDNELSNVISDYVVGNQFQEDKWSKAVMIAYDGNHDADSWKEYCEGAEEDQASRREKAGELVKRTKAGKVVASAAFPKTWNTDKSIIGKALAAGVALVDDEGNAKPKTALQAEYREANEEGKEEKSAYEKIGTVLNAYKALFAQLSTSEQEIVMEDLARFHSSAH
jgi:hypothetical protein